MILKMYKYIYIFNNNNILFRVRYQVDTAPRLAAY